MKSFSRLLCDITQNRIACKPPWRVLFFGTDKFAVKPLEGLEEHRYSQNTLGIMIRRPLILYNKFLEGNSSHGLKADGVRGKGGGGEGVCNKMLSLLSSSLII